MLYAAFYRGTVADADDPRGLGRARVKVPQILGDSPTGWATPMVKVGVAPATGDPVWVAFEGGDISFPIFLVQNLWTVG